MPRRETVKRCLKIIVPLAAVCLAPFALHSLNVREIGHRIAALPRPAIILAVVFGLAQLTLLATRFWLVIGRSKRPRWATVARAFSFGQFANLYLPARAGDVLRGVVLAKDDARLTVSDATGAMLADKGLDVATLALVGVAFGHGVLLSALAASGHTALLAGGALAVLALAWVLVRRFFPKLHERLRTAATATWTSARGLLTPKRFALGFGLGVAAWMVEVAMLGLICAGLGVHVTFAQATAALVVLNLGIAVPVSAGNVGAYEAATVVGLSPFGVSINDALAVGMLHHAVQIMAVVLPAAIFWIADRVRSRRAARAPEAQPEPARIAADPCATARTATEA
jgi:uncharacterized membrane protein YbhN (UPF0104 family)